jgi:hypothetical protein
MCHFLYYYYVFELFIVILKYCPTLFITWDLLKAWSYRMYGISRILTISHREYLFVFSISIVFDRLKLESGHSYMYKLIHYPLLSLVPNCKIKPH